MHPTVNKLVAPGQRRPAIYRGGILQIQVTRACDRACFGCTQGSQFGGRPAMMSVDQFERACISLIGYFGVVGVFGGNPCLHPRFGELCEIMRAYFPYEQRGLWTNNLNGQGRIARATFHPPHSNFNVHLSSEAYEEFRRDWPEALPYVKGLHEDSIHGSPWVSMTDLGISEEERWRLIADCDINRHWSALIGVVRGDLRAFFCEVAYAMTALHADDPDWPDTGLDVTPGWWRRPMADFESQVNLCCHSCGVPMRRPGQLAIGGSHEEFSETHRAIARPKVKDRPVQVVSLDGFARRSDRPSTEYLPNTTPGYNR